MPGSETEAIRRRFDSIERDLAALRLLVVGDAHAPAQDPQGWIRYTRLLEAFVQAPQNRLLAGQVSQLARSLGYDPRGTAGFYAGKSPSLKKQGDWRVLTDVGRSLYKEHAWRLRGAAPITKN